MKHNFLRRLGALFLAFALALSLAAPAWAAGGPNTLRAEPITLVPNGAAKPEVFYTDASGQERQLAPGEYSLTVDRTDSRNDPLIVTIQPDGSVRAHGIEGTNYVTATLTDSSVSSSVSTTFAVSVIGPVTPKPLNIVVDAPGAIMTQETENDCIGIMLAEGGTANLVATVTGDKSNLVSLSWTVVENSSVASCQPKDVLDSKSAVVTASHRRGTAVIEVRVHDNDASGTVLKTFKVRVHVGDLQMEVKNEEAAGRPLINNERITLTQGKTLAVSAAVNDGANAHRDNITWSSSDPSIVAITQGANGRATLTADGKKFGQVVITASGYGVSAKFDVVVPEPGAVAVRSVTLNRNELRLSLNESFDLIATVSPSNANREVTWRSADPTIAEVDEKGRVTALKVGTTTITVTSAYDSTRKAECKVTVSPGLTSLRINDTTSTGKLTLTSGFTSMSHSPMTISVTVNPNDAVTTRDTLIWTSSDTSVVTVTPHTNPVYTDGRYALLNWVGPGEATITVQYGSGENAVKGTCTVETPGIVITSELATMTGGRITMQEGKSIPLGYKAFGAAKSLASGTVPNWASSDSSVVDVDRITGSVTARQSGTSTITLSLGSYEAKCTITVVEDTSSIVNGGTVNAGAPYTFDKLLSAIQSVCYSKTGGTLNYITNLAVASTEQGILHDEHRSSADTGAGVGIQDRYYRSPNTSRGQSPLSDLSFVPRNNFSGTAEISFTGWSTENKSFNGLIRINVNGTGDVMYSSSEGSPVNFVADDFNFYHPNLRSVSFTPPQDSVGTLYYNYTSASQPGTKVTSGATYSRTGNPSLNRVTFVPASGYQGTAKISYKGTDTSGRSFTGVVTITVTKGNGTGSDPADISYSVQEDSWLTLRPSDFNAASLRTLGESLSYVRFTPPPSSEGTLFYNYRGFSDFDSMVNNTTSYYYGGNPSLGGVSFVPTTTTSGQVDIPYTGYTTRGNTFEGVIHIGLNDTPQEQNGLRYTVFTGRSVYLNAGGFNTACVAATGASLSSIQFTQLPGVSQGTLRYTRGNSSTPYNVTTGTRFYYTGNSTTSNLIGSVYFQANSNYTGTVTIPFTGYNTSGTSFTGEVVITVTPPTASDITYSGTTASPIRLYASRIQSANSDVLSNVSYITFTNLPSTTAGRLYTGYSGFGTGTQVNTGTRYYVSGYPSIDQISFVPRGRYSGQVTVGYTAVSTSGQSVNGRMVFNITSTGGSSYFSDMYGHTWAAPSVDYLYQNGVTKGVTTTTFGPNQRILRCDFVLMLCRAFNFNGANGYSFADVPTDSYYSQAVATAKRMGIVNGDGANFRPYSQLTRQDAMVMIKNALDAAGWNVANASTSVLGRFSDGNSVSSYARNAVSTLVQLGAVNGDNGRLLPHNPITRAEAAVILHFVMTM